MMGHNLGHFQLSVATRAYSDNAHDVTASPATTLDGSGSYLLLNEHRSK